MSSAVALPWYVRLVGQVGIAMIAFGPLYAADSVYLGFRILASVSWDGVGVLDGLNVIATGLIVAILSAAGGVMLRLLSSAVRTHGASLLA